MRSVRPSPSPHAPPQAVGNRRARVVFREILSIPQRFVAGKPAESSDARPFIRAVARRKAAPALTVGTAVWHSGMVRTVPAVWHELKHLAQGATWTMTNIAPCLVTRRHLGRAIRATRVQPGDTTP